MFCLKWALDKVEAVEIVIRLKDGSLHSLGERCLSQFYSIIHDISEMYGIPVQLVGSLSVSYKAVL